MNYHESLIKIVKTLDIPDSFKKDLIGNISRIYKLLWGPGGPFADGYQFSDWLSVSLLVSNWIMEIVADIPARNEFNKLREIIKDNPEYIARVGAKFTVGLIDHELIEIPDPQAKMIIKFILNSKTFIPTVIQNINTCISVLDSVCENCCLIATRKNSQAKKIKKLTKVQITRSRETHDILKKIS